MLKKKKASHTWYTSHSKTGVTPGLDGQKFSQPGKFLASERYCHLKKKVPLGSIFISSNLYFVSVGLGI